MEDDIMRSQIESPYFDNKKLKKQLELIKKASETAQKKMNYEIAHDDDILRSIEVVENFLRTKHRLCYGGQAINAHLPKKYKIYDPELSIPDYDFFTPDQPSDIRELLSELRKAGFSEISVREGMHEGTMKVYVNFTAVADITQIDKNLYRLLSQREFKYDGISYLDANTLRMLMYLELSRPRGEVERWSKVYERLALFNEFVPIKQCSEYKTDIEDVLTLEQSSYLFNYIRDNKRTFAGADLLPFFTQILEKKSKMSSIEFLLGTKKPFIFLSPNAEDDAKRIRTEFNILSGKANTTIRSIKPQGGDLIPEIKIVTQGNKFLAFIIQQSACHSYLNVYTDKFNSIRIASTDTLITLYFSLGLIDPKYFAMGAMECLANELIYLSIKARNNPKKFLFPFISIKCSGYQTSLPSLIRAKVRRITEKKKNMKNMVENNDNTVSKKSQKNKTAKKSKSVKKSVKKPKNIFNEFII